MSGGRRLAPSVVNRLARQPFSRIIVVALAWPLLLLGIAALAYYALLVFAWLGAVLYVRLTIHWSTYIILSVPSLLLIVVWALARHRAK